MNGQRAIGTAAAPAHPGGTSCAARAIPGTGGGITGTGNRAITRAGTGAITRTPTGAITRTDAGKPATRSVTR